MEKGLLNPFNDKLSYKVEALKKAFQLLFPVLTA